MDREMTVGTVLDEIAEMIAAAKSFALTGEREAALGTLRLAALEMARWGDVLNDAPGYREAQRAFEVAEAALTEQRLEMLRGCGARRRERRKTAFDLAA